MAKDSLGREIDYLRISVTDRCNHGCIYCVPEESLRRFDEDEILRTGEIERIVRVAMEYGVRKVRLTGGEPLLRSDIFSLVGRIKKIGVRNLSLTTNGTMLSQMAGPLKEAGLDRVNVSLDTMDPEKYSKITGGVDIEKVYDGIREAESAGLSPVKINIVPIRGINDNEIVDFARLTVETQRHVRFIEFMPSGRKGLWNKDRCISTQEVMEKVSEIGPLEHLPFRGRGPSRNYRLRGAEGVIGFISPVSHSFCYSCNRLRINAVGRIRPCLFSSTEIDVGSPLRNGAGEDEIKRLFALALKSKPEGNYLNRPSEAALRDMSRIGG
jgi:cyclic pyranopterin phosphate synthase